VIHIHFNGANANDGGLGIGQINIRHGTRIGRSRRGRVPPPQGPDDGQWRVELAADHGVEIFSCPDRFPAIRAYRPNRPNRPQWPNNPYGQLMEQFIDQLNALEITRTGMFEGHSPSLLLRGDDLTPVFGPQGQAQYVINPATSRWTADQRSTISFERGSLRPYDPVFRGDFPPSMLTNDFVG
jgi:hypothetical protein